MGLLIIKSDEESSHANYILCLYSALIWILCVQITTNSTPLSSFFKLTIDNRFLAVIIKHPHIVHSQVSGVNFVVNIRP